LAEDLGHTAHSYKVKVGHPYVILMSSMTWLKDPSECGQERAEEIKATIQKCQAENQGDLVGKKQCMKETISRKHMWQIKQIVRDAGITWECEGGVGQF